MTREEIFKYLFGTKISLKDKWSEVKEILSNLGFVNIDTAENPNDVFLYIGDKIMFRGDNKEDFYLDKDYREIPVNEILGFKEISENSYRPFKNDDECWEEMKKHEPFGWVKNIDDEKYYIFEVNKGIGTSESFHPYNEALCTVKFLDENWLEENIYPYI